MKTIRHQSLALVSACIAVLTQTSPQAWSAQLPSDSPYQAIDGRIEAEAENYHQITDSQTHAWSIINEVDGVISNPQGGQYIKSGPNLNVFDPLSEPLLHHGLVVEKA